MIKQSLPNVRNDLRNGAEQVRSNILQSTKDQQDLIDIVNREEETIYQKTKTNKGTSTRKLNYSQDSKCENSVEDSFMCNKQDFQESFLSYSIFNNIKQNNCSNQSQNAQLKDEFSEIQVFYQDKQNPPQKNGTVHDQIDENSNKNNRNLLGIKQNQLLTLQLVEKDNNKSELLISPTQNNTFFNTIQFNTQHNESNSYKIQYFENNHNSVLGLTGSWKKNPLIIITKIKQFILQMKNYSNTLKFQQMNQNQFEYIGDVSSDYKYYYMNNFLLQSKISVSKWQKLWYSAETKFNLYFQNKQKLKSMILTLKSGAIQPHSFTKILWELILFISILWQIFYVPFFIAFSSSNSVTLNDQILKNLLYIQIPIILYVDIIINFFSAYYSKGKLEIRRIKIFEHYVKKGNIILSYSFISNAVMTLFLLSNINMFNNIFIQDQLIYTKIKEFNKKKSKQLFSQLIYLIIQYLFFLLKGKFFIDLLVAIVFLFNIFLRINWLNYLIFFKIQRLTQIYNNFEEKVNLRYKYSSLIDLSNLAFNILFIAHICGCFFFLVAVIENSYGIHSTWVDHHNLFERSIAERYITSIYWAVITMITLGYGDFVPQTVYEKAFVIFITLISCGVFAYSVNQIGSIITNMTQQRLQFQQKIAQISGYLQERGVQSELLMRIKKNFAYLHSESVKDMEIHKIISTQLSKSLHKEVLRDIYIKVLLNCKIFKLNFSEQFLQHLAPLLKERKFAPEEVIYEQGSVNQNLYFIIRGQVSLNFDLNGEKKQIKLLQKNDVFGEYSFFNQNVADHSAISINVANLVYVNLNDFLQVIKEFSNDFQMYCMIKDKINLLSTTKRLGMKCFSCDQFQHQIKDCPFINYLPNKEKILSNHNLETKQERDSSFLERRNYFEKQEKAIIYQKQLQEEVINFIIEKNIYENLHDLIQILKNQSITVQENIQDMTEKAIESQTQKSIQVLYPRKLVDNMTENYTEGIEEYISPSEKKLMSPTKQDSLMLINQMQASTVSPILNKFKRTQTQIVKSETHNYNTSLKLISTNDNNIPSNYDRKDSKKKSYISYISANDNNIPQNYDRKDSKKKSYISFIHSQLLRESSRKILIDELESIKEQSGNQNNSQLKNEQLNQSIIVSNITQTDTQSLNSSLVSQQQLQCYRQNGKDIQPQNNQTFNQQQSLGNSIKVYMNSMNNISQQKNQNPQQTDLGNKIQREQGEHNNFKKQQSQNSQNQRNQICNINQNELRLKEISNEVLKNKVQKSNQNLYCTSNPINMIYNSHSQFNNQSLQYQINTEITNFDLMSLFKIYFPHNNYQVSIEKYNNHLKKMTDRQDSSVKKREKINQLRQTFQIFKGSQRNSQNSHRNSKVRMKSVFNLNNKIIV